MKTLTGKTVTTRVNGGLTVVELKKIIQDKEGIPLDGQRCFVIHLLAFHFMNFLLL